MGLRSRLAQSTYRDLVHANGGGMGGRETQIGFEVPIQELSQSSLEASKRGGSRPGLQNPCGDRADLGQDGGYIHSNGLEGPWE